MSRRNSLVERNMPILYYSQRHDSADHFRETRYEPRLISTCSIRSHALDHPCGNPAARACARAIDPRRVRDNAAAWVILGSWSRVFGSSQPARARLQSLPSISPNISSIVKVSGRRQEAPTLSRFDATRCAVEISSRLDLDSHLRSDVSAER